MKFSFRRRRRRPSKPRAVKPLEAPDWPAEGTGKGTLMSAIRGDSETGAGFGGAVFQEIHAAFSGAKRVQIDTQEQERNKRQTLHNAAPPPANLESGRIQIRKPDKPAGEESPPDKNAV